MDTIEQITAAHASHTEHIPYCGVCRFEFIYRFKNSPLWSWDVRLKVKDGESLTFESYPAGLDWLREHGFTDTHWNWEDRRYLGGNNVYGRTQEFSVTHTFRKPGTDEWAWLDYKSEEKR